jgi:hypothetical protein
VPAVQGHRVGGCPEAVDRHSEFGEAYKMAWIKHVAEEVQAFPVFQRVCAELVYNVCQSVFSRDSPTY